jgi:DNA-binding response OmpR family regulator
VETSSKRIDVGNRRLLIIDDEPDIGAILKYIAEDCGYEAAATLSADEFKTAYATFKPTAVIVDLVLPDTDGIELFRWLADQGCTLPILILSGFDDKVLESAKLLGEARGLRICGTVTKPMDVKGVRDVLESL